MSIESNSSTKASILIDSARTHSVENIAKLLGRMTDRVLRGYVLINFQAEKLRSQAAGVTGKTMVRPIFNNLYIS